MDVSRFGVDQWIYPCFGGGRVDLFHHQFSDVPRFCVPNQFFSFRLSEEKDNLRPVKLLFGRNEKDL